MKLIRLLLLPLLFVAHVFATTTPPAPTSPKPKICFIVNPISGTKSKKKIPALIQEKIDGSKFDHVILFTKGAGDATILSKQAAKERYACVVAVGGDGTVNEVAKGVVNTKTALGIIPMGSGNGLAKHLKLPSNPTQALKKLNQMRTCFIDSVAINDDLFFGTAGIGFDAKIAEEFAKRDKRGFLSYLKLIVKEYPKYEPKEIELIVDGQKMHKKALVISFANSSQYGNNVKIAPKAKIDDGYLDLVFLETPPKHATLSTSLKIVANSIHHSKYCQTIRCKEVIIKEPKLTAHVDGEPRLFNQGAHIKLIPSSLKVVY